MIDPTTAQIQLDRAEEMGSDDPLDCEAIAYLRHLVREAEARCNHLGAAMGGLALAGDRIPGRDGRGL